MTGEYRVVAFNTATTSANKIHDDEIARRYGFRGGLVPGVDAYAYLTHPPAEAWGMGWLQRGTMRARFMSPVYEGDEVVVVPAEVIQSPGRDAMPLELRNSDGEVCAVGEASLPTKPGTAPPVTDWGEMAQISDPQPASPETLSPGTSLGLTAHGFHADRADEYLTEVRETLPLYADAKVAHPGWLLRDANYVLSANVTLGPWIHVESVVQHHDLVRDGEMVEAQATVTREWESKGHRFVELDVGLIADRHVVAQITHTAIYRPRQLDH